MFVSKDYDKVFYGNYKAGRLPMLPDPKYGVAVDLSLTKDQPHWKMIGVHHLTPSENRGNRNIFITVLDENGERIKQPKMWAGWLWEGMFTGQVADPALLDKPDNEAMGNISVGANQKIAVWIKGQSKMGVDFSDTVRNLHTLHPDEAGPNGENWNSRGHHSFYVVFVRATGDATPEEPATPAELDLSVDEERTIKFALEYAKKPFRLPMSSLLILIAKLAKALKLTF